MNKILAIRVQVVDDHPVVRDGLGAAINYQSDMQVVAKSANGIDALEDYRKLKPDVTLMDLRMPVMDGVTAIAAIRSEFPEARIMVLTTYDGDEDIYRGLAAGAVGYLLKDAPMEEVLKAIRGVYRQKTRILQAVAITPADSIISTQMTPRELEVLSLLSRGYTIHAIGSALFVVEDTVQAHISNICAKLAAGGQKLAEVTAPSNRIPNSG